MKRFTLIALLATFALAGCDDLPFHDEGWHGRGHGHGHGHHDDLAAQAAHTHGAYGD